MLDPGARVAVYCPLPNARVQVPSVLGEDIGEAKRILLAAGLTPRPNGNRGKVTKQKPGPGTWHAKGSLIQIGVFYRPQIPTRPELSFAVPRLVGRSLSQLPEVIGAGRLRLQRMNRGGVKINRQEPAPGQRLPRDGMIRVWLAAMPTGSGAIRPRPSRCPSSARRPIDAAKSKLSALGLKVSISAYSTTPVPPASASIPGVHPSDIELTATLAAMQNRSGAPVRVTVVRTQSVAGGKRLALGSTVQLTTIIVERAAPEPERKEPPKLLRVPKVLGMWKQAAGDLLRREGFRVRFTGKAVGRVTSQNPTSNKELPPGSAVTLRSVAKSLPLAPDRRAWILRAGRRKSFWACVPLWPSHQDEKKR